MAGPDVAGAPAVSPCAKRLAQHRAAGALATGTLPVFVSTAAWLLSNKLNHAWLWADLDLLPETDRALIRRYVPHTVALTADRLDRALAEQADLVAKPAGGSAGHGVRLPEPDS